jgi:hypothetical protein
VQRQALTAAVTALLLATAPATAQSRPAAAVQTVVAMDHLESKGVTMWIVAGAGGERSLVTARLGAPQRTRMRGRPLRDVLIDASAKTAYLLVEQNGGLALEQITIDGDEAPRVVVADLPASDPSLGRAGDDVYLLSKDAVLAIGKNGEPRPLFRREDPAISGIAMNARQTIVATSREGEIELVSVSGELLGGLGQGRSPVFVDDGDLAFVREWEEQASAGSNEGRRSSEVLLADVGALEVPGRPLLNLGGEITRLRFAGDASILFRHVPEKGEGRYWLFHIATGVIRPMDLSDFGALSAAASRPATRPTPVNDPAAANSLPEPETPTSGFFITDESGNESRTAYEESGFDDSKHPEEGRIHAALLARFLSGVQWPFRRQAAYEPFVASDDEPLRPFSPVPHRGLDLGSRLMHSATGSPAFYAPGTYVYPLYRGGQVWFGATSSREAFGRRQYAILQEVELRDLGYVLRIHIAYEHADPYAVGGVFATPSEPFSVTGDDPVGDLAPYSDAVPTGGWLTSDPAMLASGIAKGNHIHVGIGGIYSSFNGTVESAARKLRWYRDMLIPALKRPIVPR